jgi:hypothetical protein
VCGSMLSDADWGTPSLTKCNDFSTASNTCVVYQKRNAVHGGTCKTFCAKYGLGKPPQPHARSCLRALHAQAYH